MAPSRSFNCGECGKRVYADELHSFKDCEDWKRERSDASAQVYWRIRRADGSYFAGHMLEGSQLRVLWSSVSVARTYDRKPISLEHIVKGDPTARVVRVTVRHKVKRPIEEVTLSMIDVVRARRRKAGK